MLEEMMNMANRELKTSFSRAELAHS